MQNGEHIVYYHEDVSTKTNQGGLNHKKISTKKVTIFPNFQHPECCLVAVVYKYYAKLPPYHKNNALYLCPRVDNKASEDSYWYCDMPLGINKLQTTIKDMCHEAGFQGNYSNHSLRSTSATHIYHAGIDEQTICEITGHRSNAVQAYKCTSTL